MGWCESGLYKIFGMVWILFILLGFICIVYKMVELRLVIFSNIMVLKFYFFDEDLVGDCG